MTTKTIRTHTRLLAHSALHCRRCCTHSRSVHPLCSAEHVLLECASLAHTAAPMLEAVALALRLPFGQPRHEIPERHVPCRFALWIDAQRFVCRGTANANAQPINASLHCAIDPTRPAQSDRFKRQSPIVRPRPKLLFIGNAHSVRPPPRMWTIACLSSRTRLARMHECVARALSYADRAKRCVLFERLTPSGALQIIPYDSATLCTPYHSRHSPAVVLVT